MRLEPLLSNMFESLCCGIFLVSIQASCTPKGIKKVSYSFGYDKDTKKYTM